jgi:hypothetical protein
MVRFTKSAPAKDTDEAFIRRLSRDLRGSDPTETEVHFFVSSADPKKRQKLVDLFIKERGAKALPGGRRVISPEIQAAIERHVRAREKVAPTPEEKLVHDLFKMGALSKEAAEAALKKVRAEAEKKKAAEKASREKAERLAELKALLDKARLDVLTAEVALKRAKGEAEVEAALADLRMKEAILKRAEERAKTGKVPPEKPNTASPFGAEKPKERAAFRERILLDLARKEQLSRVRAEVELMRARVALAKASILEKQLSLRQAEAGKEVEKADVIRQQLKAEEDMLAETSRRLKGIEELLKKLEKQPAEQKREGTGASGGGNTYQKR